MIESVTFPVGDCPSCGRDVLLAGELGDDGEIVYVCSHCSHPMSEGFAPRELGAQSLALRGYTVEGEIDSGGCGSDSDGGCSSCG